jgi:D-alanyl-D-alanine carboxypeptidase
VILALFVTSLSHKKEEDNTVSINKLEHSPLLLDNKLEAKAAFVLDVRDNIVLYEYNADTQLPLASITKLLSVLVAHEYFPRGTELSVSKTALEEEGDSGLILDEVWDIDALLSFILVTSSNDGVALLNEIYNEQNNNRFSEALDRKAREIGLSTFSIRNATGLDLENPLRAANYGSARDVATLFSYALYKIPDILDATRTSVTKIASKDHIHLVENTNHVVDLIPNAVGGKTGFTDVAGGNLVMSFDRDIGKPIVVVVLGSSKDGRFSDMQTLVNAVLNQKTTY